MTVDTSTFVFQGFVGEKYTAQLELRDQFGGRYCGGAEVAASVLDGDAPLFAAATVDLGNGVREVSFTPQAGLLPVLEPLLDTVDSKAVSAKHLPLRCSWLCWPAALPWSRLSPGLWYLGTPDSCCV